MFPGFILDEVWLQIADLVPDILICLTIEWELESQQGMKYDTKRPAVDFTVKLLSFIKQFWSHVRYAPTGVRAGFQQLLCGAQAEVWYADVRDLHGSLVVVDEDIVEFEVTVHDTIIVAVLDPCHNLFEDLFNFLLAKRLLKLLQIIKYGSLHQRQDNYDIFFAFEDIDAPENVRMTQVHEGVGLCARRIYVFWL